MLVGRIFCSEVQRRLRSTRQYLAVVRCFGRDVKVSILCSTYVCWYSKRSALLVRNACKPMPERRLLEIKLDVRIGFELPFRPFGTALMEDSLM